MVTASVPEQMGVPAGVRAALGERGYEFDGSEFLTRRPDRLTVGLRTPSGTPAVGKLYPAGGGDRAFLNMRALWESPFGERRDPPGPARPIEYIQEPVVLIMEHLGGRPVLELEYLAEEPLRNSVELLAALHGSGAALGSVPRTDRELVCSHGDFSPRNVLAGAALHERLDFHLGAALLRMVASRVELWREESYLIPRLIAEAVARVARSAGR